MRRGISEAAVESSKSTGPNYDFDSHPSPHTVDEIITRAGRPDFDRWAEQVARCGHCSPPVRLRGRVEHRSADGRRVAYSTDAEPDRVLLVRWGNRRAAACPSCSYEYAADMWQLLYAGAAGGRKGIPESIQSHPRRPIRRASAVPPTKGKPQLCQHGRPTWCTAVHADDDRVSATNSTPKR